MVSDSKLIMCPEFRCTHNNLKVIQAAISEASPCSQVNISAISRQTYPRILFRRVARPHSHWHSESIPSLKELISPQLLRRQNRIQSKFGVGLFNFLSLAVFEALALCTALFVGDNS